MIRFYVVLLPEGTAKGFDSIDDANAVATRLKRSGLRAFVEARDEEIDISAGEIPTPRPYDDRGAP